MKWALKDEKKLVKDGIAGRGRSQFKGMVEDELEKKDYLSL